MLAFGAAWPVAAAPVAEGLPLWGGRLFPVLAMQQVHGSNYLRLRDAVLPDGQQVAPLATWVTILKPKLSWSLFRGQRAARAYRIEYEARIGTVHAARINDYTDQRFAASANWEANLGNRFRAEYEFLRWHDRRGSGDPNDVTRPNLLRHPDLWKSNRFELGWSIGRPGSANLIDLWTIHHARRYINNQQESRDNDRITLNATVSRLLAPKTRGVLQINWHHIDYIRERPGVPTLDSVELKLYGGLLWDVSRKTSLNLRAGYLGKDFVSPLRPDVSGAGWELEARWRPDLRRTVLDLAARRLPKESAGGVADSVFINVYEAKWLHYLKPNRLWYELGGWFTSDDYIGEPRIDHRWEVRAGLYGRVRNRLSLGVDFVHQQRDSPLPAARYSNEVLQFNVELRF